MNLRAISFMTTTKLNRRGLLLGLASALAAPAIVHAGNLMPVKTVGPYIYDPRALFKLLCEQNYCPVYWDRAIYWSTGGGIEWREISAEDFYV